MNWINIPVSLLRSPEYAGADPIQRATWLNLLGYCCEQENQGEIAGCLEWRCRRWQQTCGVTLEETRVESDLWEWRENNIIVAFYPLDKEEEVKAKREAGRKGGKKSGVSRKSKKAQPEAVVEAQLQGVLERKRKEEKGKEKKENEKEQDSEFLENLWKSCPSKGRERSSRAKVRTAWKNLSPKAEPDKVAASLAEWKESEAWQESDGKYVPALDRWIRDRKFEIQPEKVKTHRSKKLDAEYETEIDLTGLKL